MKTPRDRAARGTMGPGGLRARFRPQVSAAAVNLRREILAHLQAFFGGHRERMQSWGEGDCSSPFPDWTYNMVMIHGASVERTSLPWNLVRPP